MRLKSQLNINNQNIKLYFQNFMEARALIREARSQYFPILGPLPLQPAAHFGKPEKRWQFSWE